jgi:hypothetical protein
LISRRALLGAGSEVLVDFGGAVKLQVQKGALDALVENGGAIRADGGTGLASNYTLTQPGTVSGSITQKALSVSGITVADKVYDGGTLATVNAAKALFNGLVAGDAVSVSASGAFSDRNAGSGKTVPLTSSYAGRDAGNYTITARSARMASRPSSPAPRASCRPCRKARSSKAPRSSA